MTKEETEAALRKARQRRRRLGAEISGDLLEFLAVKHNENGLPMMGEGVTFTEAAIFQAGRNCVIAELRRLRVEAKPEQPEKEDGE